MSNKSKKIIGFVVIGLFIALSAYVTVRAWPYISGLATEEGRELFKERIADMGFGGWLVMLGIQMLQVVVAVIPGEPIEVIAGFLYGTWGGLFTCLLGLMLGTLLIIAMVKLLKSKFISLFISQEQLDSYKFLKNEARLESIAFVLFLIPGTPKDVLTYAVALTKINPWRFLTISTFARIPSVVSSTWAGASIMDANWGLTIGIFAATALIGLLGIWLNKKYTKKLEEKNDENA